VLTGATEERFEILSWYYIPADDESGWDAATDIIARAMQTVHHSVPLGVTWAERPELAPGLYAVACEAYPDVPGEETTLMDPYEEWLSNDMQGDSDRPDATFIALVDGEVAGYAKLALSKSDAKVAYHDMTGVLRAYRGRGIASALKRTQIRWAKQAGYEKLQTANEVRNAPIRALNQRHGYKLAPGLVTLRDALSGPD